MDLLLKALLAIISYATGNATIYLISIGKIRPSPKPGWMRLIAVSLLGLVVLYCAGLALDSLITLF
jgi:hypothetical protein